MTNPDMGDIFRQATGVRQQLESVRDNLVEVEVTGTARGGGVSITMTVGGEFRRVRIDPEVHADGPPEVEDAVLQALRDCATQLRQHAARQLEGLQDMIGGALNGYWPKT